jgi:hypothetical protein
VREVLVERRARGHAAFAFWLSADHASFVQPDLLTSILSTQYTAIAAIRCLSVCPLTNRVVSQILPLLENYQDRTVKSLVLCCIELATGKRAVIKPEQKVAFGMHELRLDARNCVQATLPLKDECEYIPFHRFVTGDIPASLIQGKVVIIGYDSPQIHSISTSIGQVRAHRQFIYVLQSIYEQLGT